MVCLCVAALIGTMHLLPSCKCFLASSGDFLMNIHTELSPRVCHLINIQETLIDYNVFAGMCSLLMSAGWIKSVVLSVYVIQLILSTVGAHTHTLLTPHCVQLNKTLVEPGYQMIELLLTKV